MPAIDTHIPRDTDLAPIKDLIYSDDFRTLQKLLIKIKSSYERSFWNEAGLPMPDAAKLQPLSIRIEMLESIISMPERLSKKKKPS